MVKVSPKYLSQNLKTAWPWILIFFLKLGVSQFSWNKGFEGSHGNPLETKPKHVLKTSWNLRTNKEHLKNFSSKRLEKRGFGDQNIWDKSWPSSHNFIKFQGSQNTLQEHPTCRYAFDKGLKCFISSLRDYRYALVKRVWSVSLRTVSGNIDTN